jgi:hypothetical protein
MQIDRRLDNTAASLGLLLGSLFQGIGPRHFDYTTMCNDC